ncbi:MAG: roadblock/LC7 domain-containing protein [candidate division NC10 bacterium]|nr:roadblock/LC7 domain-containing protein [candidate division NC10 bacterium]
MIADPSRTVGDLVKRVGQARGALLMHLDGVPIAQAPPEADLDSLAGEYAGLLRQAQALAAELDLGAARSFSVRAASHPVVFAFVPGDLALGVETRPSGLRGQMRHALAQALGQLGEQ